MTTSSEFNGQHVLVTGGSQGVGLAVAKAFLARGATVSILSDRANVKDVADELSRAFGRAVTPVHADITDRPSLYAKVRALPSIHVLISNAGIGDITPIDSEAADADALFDRIIAVNLIGAYNVVRAALPRMGTGGRIIFTSSVHGQAIAPPGMGGYTASKGGLEALMRSLARELGPKGITVNAVAPGMVATEMTLSAIRKLFSAQLGTPNQMDEAEMIRQLNTTQAIHGTPIDPDHLAAAYVFLASAAGGEITGQSLNVDHGMMMK